MAAKREDAPYCESCHIRIHPMEKKVIVDGKPYHVHHKPKPKVEILAVEPAQRKFWLH